MTTWYFHYQATPESEWLLAMSDQRERIVKDKRPPFTTILDTDNGFTTEMNADDLAKVHYRGPFYIDLDSDDPAEVIGQFKKLLRKLREDYSVDLDQLALYATGGRGFHIIFTQDLFISKVPPRGMMVLPLVYREMAMELFVDTLDLNIYSMKKGRMFREKNVERTNGNFKVQITTQEALEMTVEQYKVICAHQRHMAPPTPPTYNPDLGLMFAKAQSKISDAVKKRKSAKADANILKSFGGKIPPTLLSVMSGDQLEEGVGFQKIATQLAIAAHAMNMRENEFLEACEGLISGHKGDSQRYGTPAKRKRELARMYAYMAGNPCYSFSVGGIKSMMVRDAKAPDLDMGSMAPSGDEPDETGDDETKHSISQGVRITNTGIYKKTEDGVVLVSAIGLSNPKQLLDLHNGEVHGYEVDVSVEGKPTRPKIITMDCFASRSSFLRFTLSAGSCNIGLTDAQIGSIADILRVRTMKNNQQVYTVRREGIDLVTTPTGEVDIIWADQFGVSSNRGVNYRLTGSMTEDLQFRTDLRQAPCLEDTDEAREFFRNMFQINRPEVVGRIFGFMLSTFLSQPIRHVFNKFPFLQVYGPAGSGKSETIKLLARLHYYNQEPLVSSALDSTRFLYEEMSCCSGSIPFILDEYKPREMRKDLLEKSKGILRSNYNGDSIGKGGISSTTGQSKLTINRVSNRSPMIVLGEAIISQTAILDRCVAVSVSKEGKKDRRDAFQYCQSNRHYLSMLGRLCIDGARSMELHGLRLQVERNMQLVREQVGSKADDNDRPLYNVAVLLTGLEFGRRLMVGVFGDLFDADFKAMKLAITAETENLIPKVVSEAAKVMDVLAYLSRFGEDERTKLASGEDFVHLGLTIQLRMKNCYAKYVRFRRSLGEEVMYDSYEAFYNAMSTYPGTVDTICTESGLKDSASTAVFEFSTVYLLKDNVEEFRN
jgi:hypothetical protein